MAASTGGREGVHRRWHMTKMISRRLRRGSCCSRRGFSVGSAGNISVRLADGYLITPTNSSLGRLDPARLSQLDADFRHVGGDKPSKEVFMHRAFYRARPDAGAVVHLHSTMATAVACLPRRRRGESDPAADALLRHAGRTEHADRRVLPPGRSGDGAGDPRRGDAMPARCCWRTTGRWCRAGR